jgi:hypothetical protein
MVSPSGAVSGYHQYIPNAHKPACRCAYPCVVCGLDAQDDIHHPPRDQGLTQDATREE